MFKSFCCQDILILLKTWLGDKDVNAFSWFHLLIDYDMTRAVELVCTHSLGGPNTPCVMLSFFQSHHAHI